VGLLMLGRYSRIRLATPASAMILVGAGLVNDLSRQPGSRGASAPSSSSHQPGPTRCDVRSSISKEP
jgi:hypothetical protein